LYHQSRACIATVETLGGEELLEERREEKNFGTLNFSLSWYVFTA
jgi:hypothetical protein